MPLCVPSISCFTIKHVLTFPRFTVHFCFSPRSTVNRGITVLCCLFYDNLHICQVQRKVYNPFKKMQISSVLPQILTKFPCVWAYISDLAHRNFFIFKYVVYIIIIYIFVKLKEKLDTCFWNNLYSGKMVTFTILTQRLFPCVWAYIFNLGNRNASIVTYIIHLMII